MNDRWIDLGGPVHYLDFGGPADGPFVVAVHGLGGSALNWLSIAPLLTDRCRLLAPDLAGHGLTRPHGRGTTVPANRALLEAFLAKVAGQPIILMGNSMGGMISLLEAAVRPEAVAGLILLDAALPFVPALPSPILAGLFTVYAMPGIVHLVMARRRSLSPQQQVAMVLRICCVRPERVEPAVVAAHIDLARQRHTFDGVDRDILYAARSVVGTAGMRPGLRYREAVRSVTAPALLVHGAKDRLVPLAASMAIAKQRPDWQLVVLPDVGHVPMLEAPAATAGAIHHWLDGRGRAASDRARPRTPLLRGHHDRETEPA